MTTNQITESIYQMHTSHLNLFELEKYKSFKKSNVHLDWLYALLVDNYLEFALKNNFELNDRFAFTALLKKLVDE